MAGVVATPPQTWCTHSTAVNTDTFVLITSSLVPCTVPSSAAAGLQCSSTFTPPFTWSAARSLPLTPHTRKEAELRETCIYTDAPSVCACVWLSGPEEQ